MNKYIMKGLFSFFTLLFFILLHAQERPPIQVFEPKAMAPKIKTGVFLNQKINLFM